MIGYIKGNVISVKEGVALVENNGIGYELTCSALALQKLRVGSQCELFVYMAVREDGISLYGFSSTEEKNMFLKLISVSGVGPKMGITVLSGIDLGELVTKIATSDVKGLSKVKGLGKKTAERIIVELREKVGGIDVDEANPIKTQEQVEVFVNNDAVIALMSLGFSRAECIEALKKATANGAKTIEELIAYSLKNIR